MYIYCVLVCIKIYITCSFLAQTVYYKVCITKNITSTCLAQTFYYIVCITKNIQLSGPNIVLYSMFFKKKINIQLSGTKFYYIIIFCFPH